MSNTIISHIKNTGEQFEIQSNDDHQQGVAELAEKFADDFGMGCWGRILGLLHDKGKEKADFQNYIRKVSGYDENASGWTDKSHAYVGGLIACRLYKAMSSLLANPITGHHAGLYDFNELALMLTKNIPEEVDTNIEKVNLSLPTFMVEKKVQPQDFHHLVRLLYSCLVDADFLDTERFMNEEAFNLRGGKASLMELLPNLESFLANLKQKAADTEVNRIRQQVQNACIEKSEKEKGFYSLTVPTGGGKTLSSLVWAMRHAVFHGLNRIIIAIPYTSIIVQTAAILKGIFGEDNVLEHHSNFDYDNIKDSKLRHQTRLATENWDYPIVVTTNVQLFESMMSNKPSDCRKLHNICNSVVILDEVQTLPTDFLQPIVDSLKTYQKLFGTSVLLTTASQPVLSGLIEGCNPTCKFQGIEQIQEIVPDELNLHDKLRRVQLSIDNESKTYDEIAEKLSQHDRVLCIVNTRKDAKEIFDRLPDEGITLHLSRMMCPDHVSETINMVKESLADKRNTVIRVVATQLIEAGVDIDFPVVYRQESGLDSVLQAAGRCNREGKNGICTTYVFSIKDRNLYGSMKDGNYARKSLNESSDWFAPSTMTEYFKQLYCRCETFDEKDIKHYLYKPIGLMFETASHEFRLIDDSSTSVIVCWKNSLELVEQLKAEGPSYPLMKRLSKYSVNVRQGDMKKLVDIGTVEEILDGIYVISDKAQYDMKVGLLTDNHWLEEIHII